VAMAEKRVEIYLAPANRNPKRESIRELESLLKLQMVRSPLIHGSNYSVFDYAIEELDGPSAKRLVNSINKLEGYAAKSRDWVA